MDETKSIYVEGDSSEYIDLYTKSILAQRIAILEERHKGDFLDS